MANNYEEVNVELVKKIQANDDRKHNLELLYMKNIKMLEKIARKYERVLSRSDSLIYEDLLQIAYIGLHSAALSFDIDNGGSAFGPYAWNCIDTNMRNFVRNNRASIRIPAELQLKLYEINKFKDDYYAKFHEEPDIKTILEISNLSYAQYVSLAQAENAENAMRIDAPISCEDGNIEDMSGMIPGIDGFEDDVVKSVSNSEIWDIVNNALDGNELKYLTMYYNGATYEEIAKQENKTKSEIVWCVHRSLGKLRRGKATKYLREYIDKYEVANLYSRNGFTMFKETQESNVERMAIHFLKKE